MDSITLDRESFKALAAETRIKILKLLQQRRHMQSELAVSLGMKEPSVNEHLAGLLKAGLIVKKDDGRKWKYYELTAKCKAILDPEQQRILITLSLLILTAVAGAVAYIRPFVEPLLNPPVAMKSADSLALTMEAAPGTSLAMDAAQTGATYQLSLGVIVYVVWLALLIGMLSYSYYQRKKYSQFLR